MANYTTDVRSSCVGNPRLPLVWTEIPRRESTSAPAVGFSSPPFPSGAEDDDTACTTVLFPPRRSGTRTGTPQSPLPTPGMIDAVLVNHSPIRAPSDVHRRPRSDIGVVRRPPHTFFSPADPFSLNGVKAPLPPPPPPPSQHFPGERRGHPTWDPDGGAADGNDFYHRREVHDLAPGPSPVAPVGGDAAMDRFWRSVLGEEDGVGAPPQPTMLGGVARGRLSAAAGWHVDQRRPRDYAPDALFPSGEKHYRGNSGASAVASLGPCGAGAIFPDGGTVAAAMGSGLEGTGGAGAAWEDVVAMDKHGLATFFSQQEDPYPTRISYDSLLKPDGRGSPPPPPYPLGPVEPPRHSRSASGSSHIIIHHHHHYAHPGRDADISVRFGEGGARYRPPPEVEPRDWPRGRDVRYAAPPAVPQRRYGDRGDRGERRDGRRRPGSGRFPPPPPMFDRHTEEGPTQGGGGPDLSYGAPSSHNYSFDDSLSFNESLTDSSHAHSSRGVARDWNCVGGGVAGPAEHQQLMLPQQPQQHATLSFPGRRRQPWPGTPGQEVESGGAGRSGGRPGSVGKERTQVLPPRGGGGQSQQQQVQWWTPKIGNRSRHGSTSSSVPAASPPGSHPSSLDAESPPTRLAFKDFYRKFRAKERTSSQLAEEYALECLEKSVLPAKSHWRVHLELADLAKRTNRLEEARQLMMKVCQLQPFASQGWLEYSKLEEEAGNLVKTRAILREGLNYCECSESLLTKAIKLEEKMGYLDDARQLLARLKNTPIEKVWRAVLEGALLEARDGKIHVARRILRYLMKHVPWYGPIYLEAFQLELREDRSQEALAIVDRGLNEIPRYGPLWFRGISLCEKLDLRESREKGKGKIQMIRTISMVERALNSISKELLWKVHLEAAQIQERAALLSVALASGNVLRCSPLRWLPVCNELTASRKYFARAVLACPPNLSWKVWLAGGRMELNAGRDNIARKFFEKAFEQVPEKNKANVFLECSRLEDFEGNTELGRAILWKARQDCPVEWKVYLESVMLEIRAGRREKAIEIAQLALKVHNGTGRLWAVLVQLSQIDGDEVQTRVLRDALKEVPKSGEVWCEGARIHLNPFSPTFDLVKAKRYLSFARQFTPQYGDSFLESLRLELLCFLVVPLAKAKQQGMVSFSKQMVDKNLNAVLINKAIMTKTMDEVQNIFGPYKNQGFSFSFSHERVVDTTSLQLRCVNADPNYGTMWFHCRQRPTDTAKAVLHRAQSLLTRDLAMYAPIYVASLLRRYGVTSALRHERRQPPDEESDEWEAALEARLRSAPQLGEEVGGKEEGRVFRMNGGNVTGSDFLTGLFDLNTHIPTQELSPMARRKLLFGSDL